MKEKLCVERIEKGGGELSTFSPSPKYFKTALVAPPDESMLIAALMLLIF